ncbi:MAG: hypothetical protein J6R47_05090 [Acholeplasmatales bacterium]|nr:hypothetical protein [Acholeplasmatales bacterium]
MITNLVFKRTVNIEGSSRTEMKIVEINIPEIKASEGWSLVSSADKVTLSPRVTGEKSVSTTPEYELGKTDITETNDASPDKATEFLNNLIKMTDKNYAAIQNCNCAQTDKATTDAYKENLAAQSVNVAYKPSEIKEAEEAANIKEYPSPVNGTACLIRRGNIIRIAFRTGKNANVNTPNKVCINDKDKQAFFNAVRADNSGKEPIKWQLDGKAALKTRFDWWNKFIDDEYKEQKLIYIRKKNKGY